MAILITHTDFDGIASAALISSVEPIVEIRFAEPSDLQKDRVKVPAGAIISDLPFHSQCGKWFDHHASAAPKKKFEGSFKPSEKSCARVIYDYYDNPFLKERFSKMVDAADKIDTADYTKKEILNPSGYYLLSLTLDASVNETDSRGYRLLLIELLKRLPLEKIMEMPKVKQRAAGVLARLEEVKKLLPKFTKMEGKVAVVDYRKNADLAKGSAGRFLVYLQQPKCVASVRVRLSKAGNADIGIGQNIFSRSMKTNLGALCAEFGGGGHAAAAGCQVREEQADEVIGKMVARINKENK